VVETHAPRIPSLLANLGGCSRRRTFGRDS
jgi:hypothetical protein